MYKEHPVFTQPNNPEVKIWRYIDFTKLVSLLDTRRLYFTRADKFDDPFEGSWPKINVEGRKLIPEDLTEEKAQKTYLNVMSKVGETNKNWPRYAAINCWHENNHESAAMWKLYLKSDEGIAIQSTYTKLIKSLIDDETIYVGKVKYIDYETEFIQEGNIFRAFLHKRKSFEYENEIRAFIFKWPTSSGEFNFAEEPIINGLQIKVDIEALIENIFVAPSAPKWFAELVDAVVKRYGYNFKVTQSKLNNSALF